MASTSITANILLLLQMHVLQQHHYLGLNARTTYPVHLNTIRQEQTEDTHHYPTLFWVSNPHQNTSHVHC